MTNDDSKELTPRTNAKDFTAICLRWTLEDEVRLQDSFTRRSWTRTAASSQEVRTGPGSVLPKTNQNVVGETYKLLDFSLRSKGLFSCDDDSRQYEG